MKPIKKNTIHPADASYAVAVIVVTYQGQHDIRRCLQSLIPALGVHDRVYVVDNASTDATRSIVSKFDGVVLIELSDNLGFAEGNNIGFRRALQDGFGFVYCLNQDTEVDSRFLLPLKTAMLEDETIGIVQSLLLLGDDKDRINSSGNCITWAGFGYSNQYKMSRRIVAGSRGVRDIGYASGAGCLIRAQIIAMTHGFPREYFMYHEDTAISWEAVLGGYRVVIEPHSVVWHYYRFSSSPHKWYWIERNRILLIATHYKIATLIVLAPAFVMVECALLITSMQGGWFGSYLRARAWFMRYEAWRIIRAERFRINSFRCMSDKQYMRRMIPYIDFQEISSWFVVRIANPVSRGVFFVARSLIRW